MPTPSKLYIVPTPVGNVADMSPRAIETLRHCALVLAEDTRTSGQLMRMLDIDTPLASHHMHNEHATVERVVERLRHGDDIALVSDAGTPGISDPGFLLARACRQAGIVVITLPGPTALIPAVVSSGLPCDRFFFEGFLPPKKGRETRMKEIAARPVTTIIYESPLRLVRTLNELATHCGDERPASVSREISKVHEETLHGTLRTLHEHYAVNNPRGEIVIVISGADAMPRAPHRNKYASN